jgi:prepilin-type N-terminal cleavage/methylation domain-containing protein
MKVSCERGFSLVEVIIALGVLTVGVFGVAAVMTAGMQNLSGSPGDVVVTQKAADGIEAVFAGRDSHKVPWAQIRNVQGASGSDGGVFVDGPQPLKMAGPDGLVNTVDDTTVETVTEPGVDQLIGTADDNTEVLSAFTREISIRDVPNENGQLRSVTVIITYQYGSKTRTYTLSTFISSYS